MEPEDKNQLDQWLYSALKQYGEAEPRAGLEGRVLANLRAANVRASAKRTWWPVWAAVAAGIAIAGVSFVAFGNKSAKKETVAVQRPSLRLPKAPIATSPAPVLISSASRKPAHRPSVRAVKAPEPRLDQFPAPRPLTQQEEMLISYVEGRPQEAGQVAQAQAELLSRDLAEFEKNYRTVQPPQDSTQ
jgi:hypothetical protein